MLFLLRRHDNETASLKISTLRNKTLSLYFHFQEFPKSFVVLLHEVQRNSVILCFNPVSTDFYYFFIFELLFLSFKCRPHESNMDWCDKFWVD